MKREDIDSDILTYHSSVRTRKLLLMAVINVPLVMYGTYARIVFMMKGEWATQTFVAENIASLQILLVEAKSDIDVSNDSTASAMRTAILMPLFAFYHFAWFGLDAEIRKAYMEALLKLGRLISATLRAHWPQTSTPTFSWSAIVPQRAKFRQCLANALSLVLPNAPQITPYTSNVPPDDSIELSASFIRIDVQRQERVPSRESARRLSLHKPPLAAVNGIPSVLNVPLHRLSHHKPPFVPLNSLNGPAIATPSVSGSTPPRIAAANNIRQQERFESRSHARRLSYHKPPFVSLASANANSAVPDVSGPTIPLVEIPRDIIGERNAILQAENVVEDGMAPPPLSSVSPSGAPPPFSTATPAPPYREVNPFLAP
jgi:hypothetical protein